MEMIKLRYGNTNTFFLPGKKGGLLIDTDYAGTLPSFFRAIKAEGIAIRDISWVLATHYHPDHIGLIGELQKLGVKLLVIDKQLDKVHFADAIFSRDQRLHYETIDEQQAAVIRCEESRGFLRDIGIRGEIVPTPSHSEDSISIILDHGDCIVGDLEPFAYLAAYGDNPGLQRDWERIMRFHPKRIFYAHANQTEL